MITRYTMDWAASGGEYTIKKQESPTGDYVTYEDHEKDKAEAVEGWKFDADTTRQAHIATAAERDDLRRKLDVTAKVLDFLRDNKKCPQFLKDVIAGCWPEYRWWYCPTCKGDRGWDKKDGFYLCHGCGRREPIEPQRDMPDWKWLERCALVPHDRTDQAILWLRDELAKKANKEHVHPTFQAQTGFPEDFDGE